MKEVMGVLAERRETRPDKSQFGQFDVGRRDRDRLECGSCSLSMQH